MVEGAAGKDGQRKSGLPGEVGGGCGTPIAAVDADRPRRDAGSERVPDHRVEALARLKLTDDRLRQAFGERRKRIPVEHIRTGQGIHDNVGAVAVLAGTSPFPTAATVIPSTIPPTTSDSQCAPVCSRE